MASRVLLAALLLLIPTTSAYAQEDAQKLFDKGMAHFHNGDHGKAVEAFRQVVALAPDQAVAYQLLNQSQSSLLQLMVAGDEYETFAKEIIEAAASASRDAIKDGNAATEAAEACFSDDMATRSKAIFDLGFRFGPFAALPLIEAMGDQSDSRRLAAIYALGRIGMEISQPVLAATWSSSERVRSGALLVLAELNDARGAARIADLAANDESGMVRKIASQLAVAANPADMLYEQGWDYLDADPAYGLGSVENYGTYFIADGSSVVGVEMPTALVPCELAKRNFLRAMELGNADAAVALATAYATEISVLQAHQNVGEDGMESAINLQTASALTLGNEVLQGALVNAVAEGKNDAALVLVSLLDSASKTSVEALNFAVQNARTSDLRYAAALAMAGLGNSSPEVVAALTEASMLDALRVVHLIDPNEGRSASLAADLSASGIAVIRAEDGAGGLINAHRSVLVDAFIIADPLSDLYASRVVKELRKDDRFVDTPIIILGNDETGDIETAEVMDSVDAQAILDAFGDMGIDRERYLATAAAATESLAMIAMHDPEAAAAAAAALSGALGREDSIAIPATVVIGSAGNASQAEALMGLVTDDSRSTEVRTAAAKGLSKMADRVNISVDTSALSELVVSAEPPLARACARAMAALGGGHLSASLTIE
jgi:tetratricopeptide (TPR) repeat protein